MKETTSFSFGLGSTSLLVGTLHPSSSVVSEITPLSRNLSNSARSTDDLVHSAMVLAGGISGVVGWKAKAWEWNQELWREKAVGITFPLAPCLCCYSLWAINHPTTETFAWVGGGALPHHVNAIGQR